ITLAIVLAELIAMETTSTPRTVWPLSWASSNTSAGRASSTELTPTGLPARRRSHGAGPRRVDAVGPRPVDPRCSPAHGAHRGGRGRAVRPATPRRIPRPRPTAVRAPLLGSPPRPPPAARARSRPAPADGAGSPGPP